MYRLYAKWIDRWETRLATRDTNRVVRPFEWGLEWLDGVHVNGNPSKVLEEFTFRSVANSDAFFSYTPATDYRLDGRALTFRSPVPTPHERNNTVWADYFPVRGEKRRAVLVLPQWNSDAGSHVGLCKLLNRHGLPALRMSLAYHDRRMPPELQRADYHVSSNLGRTIHASRQSAIDARACLDWLASQGYDRLAILGTSLGSCIALLVAAHDARIKVGVFNHISLNFGDVVWTGISCRHIQQSLAAHLTQEQLTRLWSVISPSAYLNRLVGRDLRSLLLWANLDTSFLPVYSKQVLALFRQLELDHEVACLPCGHYTSGKMPFALWDGLVISQFLRKVL
jgi:hypothetical protein